MQYALTIYDDQSRWSEMSEEDGRAQSAAYGSVTEEMRSSGVFRAGEGLQPATTATTVRVPNGERIVTDGPFAETKEQLGGLLRARLQGPRRGDRMGGEDPDGQERMRRGSPGHPVRLADAEVDRLFRQRVGPGGRHADPRPRRLRPRRGGGAGRVARRARALAGRRHPAQSRRVDHHHRTQPRHRPAPARARAGRAKLAELEALTTRGGRGARRPAAADVHLLPPGAGGRGARGAHAAHARRPVGAGGRARLPRRRAGDGQAPGARQAQDRRRRHRLPRAGGRGAAAPAARRCSPPST